MYVFLDPTVQHFRAPKETICAPVGIVCVYSLVLIPEFFLKLETKRKQMRSCKKLNQGTLNQQLNQENKKMLEKSLTLKRPKLKASSSKLSISAIISTTDFDHAFTLK